MVVCDGMVVLSRDMFQKNRQPSPAVIRCRLSAENFKSLTAFERKQNYFFVGRFVRF